jgi:apolipoprotein N-acyltransferase
MPRSASAQGWLERFSIFEKGPFAFFFGALLGISTPGFDLWWVAWIGLAPLLVLVRASRTQFEATMTGLLFGLGYYLVALSWYLGLFPLRWLGIDDWVAVQAVGLVWVLESVHEALLLAAFAWLVYCLPLRSGFLVHVQRPYFPYMLSVPLIWVFLHWVVATSQLFLGMPVNQLAYTQHQLIDLIQLAKFGGSGLIDYILVMANCAVAAILFELTPLTAKLPVRSDQISPRVGSWVDLALVSLLVAGGAAWGAYEIRQVAMETRDENEDHIWMQTPAIPIAVLQGNVSIEERKLKTTSPTEIANRYAQLGARTGALMLFLPEGAVDTTQFGPGLLLSKLKGIVMSEKKEAVTGTVERVHDSTFNVEGVHDHLFSAARIIASPLPPDNIYVKQRLAPLGEVVSWGPLGQLSTQLTASEPTTTDSLLKIHAADLLGSIFGKIGVSISTEVIFPNLIAQEVRSGASLLVNMADWNHFHNASLNKQIVAAATLRAVENGRFMVVATNSGISAVIDPAGVVTSLSYAGKRGIIMDTVQFLYKQTPFSRMSRMWWL